MSEEVLDAEASTLSKNTGPLDHLKHLLKVGWTQDSPLIRSFVEKHNLQREIQELINGQ